MIDTNGTAAKIGFVAPRYGLEVLGGAERMLRGWAEQLHMRGYSVEVFTTCTDEVLAWNERYPPGESMLNGVRVHRFPMDQLDLGQVLRTLQKTSAGDRVLYTEQLAFIRHFINSQALYQHLRDHQQSFACFIFAPYLFGTTYWGVHAVPDKAVLLPCLHDEPFAYFSIYHELLEQARGVLFNAEAERRFAIERLGMINASTAVVGYGFDPDTPPGDAEAFRRRYDLPQELLLYSGRLEGGKNVPLLLDYFTRYKAERPGRLTLALAGKGDVVPPVRPDIVELGFFYDEQLRDAYAAAQLLCQPSVNESFSIVIMESWLQSTPVLVHGNCAVTREHVERSGGGWVFRDYEEFCDVLDQVFGGPVAPDERGRAGRAYVMREYSWDVAITRLLAALAEFTRPIGLYEQLSRRGVRRALEFSRERYEEHLAQVIIRAEADLAQGLAHSQMNTLRGAAHIAMPDYQVRSTAPIIGRLISWLRRHLTSHLREPYLDPIIAKQEGYNTLLLDTLLPALERSLHMQQRLERQIRLLERQITEMRAGDDRRSTTDDRQMRDDKMTR